MMKERIEQIMENFDFEQVHRVMVALELEWYFGLDGSRIPSIEVLKEKARELLSNVDDLICGDYTISSFYGGLEAKYVDGCLSLSFIVEECRE